MSPIKEQLIEVIDYLPEKEQFLLFEIAKRFVPDDIVTLDDLEAIETAREEFANGKTINHNNINWD